MKNANRQFCLALTAFCILSTLWLVFAKFVVPPLIENAYRGESLSIFNRMIAGQAVNSIEHYLSRWEQFSRTVSRYLFFLLPVVGLGFFLGTRPKLQHFLTTKLTPSKRLSKTELVATVGRFRIWLVYAVISLVLSLSLWDIVTDSEHWPFSPYGMYSQVERERSLTTLRLFGVAEGSSQRIPLIDFEYIQPFDQSRLRWALEGMNVNKNREQLLGDALRDCLARYERSRRAGLHHGPRLQAVDLYRITWHLDPWARNVDEPDRSEMLIEVKRPSENEGRS